MMRWTENKNPFSKYQINRLNNEANFSNTCDAINQLTKQLYSKEFRTISLVLDN